MRKKSKPKFSCKAAFALDMIKNSEILYSQPWLHMNCNGNLTVENCKRVVLYTASCIILDMGAQTVTVNGSELLLRTYDKNYLTVTGGNISIAYKKKGE